MIDAKLRYFYEAVMAGSMRAAGEKIGVAVSSISRQIVHLEEFYDAPLIEKGRRTILPTAAGELVLEYYREGMAQQESFNSRLQDLKGMKTGHIILATGEGFLSLFFSKLLNEFMSKNAGIVVTVKIAATNEVLGMVAEDEAHLGLVFNASPDPKIRARISVLQPIRVITNPSHPLAGRQSVTLSDLLPYRVCLPEANFRIRRMIEMAEMEEGITLIPHFNTNSLALLRDMVLSGDFITLMPELSAIGEISRGDLISIPIDHPSLAKTSVNLITRLGRQLPGSSVKLMNILEASLHKWTTPV